MGFDRLGGRFGDDKDAQIATGCYFRYVAVSYDTAHASKQSVSVSQRQARDARWIVQSDEKRRNVAPPQRFERPGAAGLEHCLLKLCLTATSMHRLRKAARRIRPHATLIDEVGVERANGGDGLSLILLTGERRDPCLQSLRRSRSSPLPETPNEALRDRLILTRAARGERRCPRGEVPFNDPCIHSVIWLLGNNMIPLAMSCP